MNIGICSDHAGFEHKKELVRFLEKEGHKVLDFGTNSTESMDYPDVAHPLASKVEDGVLDCGVALCGTGNGMAMSLNHHKKIRAALAWNKEIAALAKAHNNANILVLPARFTTIPEAKKILTAWLQNSFEGGRHCKRIEKIPTE